MNAARRNLAPLLTVVLLASLATASTARSRGATPRPVTGTAVLLEQAFSPDTAVRDRALEQLATRGIGALDALPVRVLDAAPRDVTPYARALAAVSSEKRREIALLWARFGRPEWVPAAAALLRPATTEALRAAVASCAGSAPAEDALLRLVAHAHTEWRDPALSLVDQGAWMDAPLVVRLLGVVAQRNDLPALDTVLRSPDPRVLVVVAKVLGGWPDGDAASRLLPLLARHHSLRVRVAAVEALAVRGDAAATEHLWPLIASGPEPLIRAAVAAIGRLHGKDAMPELERLFQTSDRATRRAVLVACKDIGSTDALRLLGRAAADGDPQIRELGLTLLAAD